MKLRFPRRLSESEVRERAEFLRRQAADLAELKQLDRRIEYLRTKGSGCGHERLMSVVNRRKSISLALDRTQARALAHGLISYDERRPHFEPDFSPAGVVLERFR